MSGNIGEKARAAFLALIMVTSVMAAGVAFSGSAAAEAPPDSPTDTPGDLQVSILNESTGTVNATFGVNTTSGTINKTNATDSDVQVASIDPAQDSARAIQFAVENTTSENNTVLVGPGTYNGSIDVRNDNIDNLESANGPEETIINGSDSLNSGNGQAIQAGQGVADYDTLTIEGFNLIGNSGTTLAFLDSTQQASNIAFRNNIVNNTDTGNAARVNSQTENLTIVDNVFDAGDNAGLLVLETGPSSAGTPHKNVTVRNNEFGSTGTAGATALKDIDGLTFSGNTLTDDGIQGFAVNLNPVGNATIADNNINVSGGGADGILVSDDSGQLSSVENISIENNEITTDSSSNAIDFQTAPTGEVSINGNQIDQSDIGISIDATDSAARVNIDSTTVNGTSTAGIDIAGVNSNAAVNITDSELTQNEEGIRLSDSAGDAQVNVHFNTFEENVVGVADDGAGPDATHNLTFNDFVDNDDGLVLDDDSGTVNANYSYWGDTTGPADADDGTNVNNAFGDGDSVALSSSGDATVFPYLTASTSNTISSAQKSGSELIVIPDPEKPIGDSNDDNTALVTVTNLNESVGATKPDVFASGAIVSPKNSFSGTLSPSNVATFNVNSSSVGTVDVQGVADGASSSTVTQTYTGQSANVTFSANNSGVTSDTPVQITATAVDSNGNAVERQGLSVRFAESSGFDNAGVQFKSGSRDTNTNNNGDATAIVESDGTLSPGSQFTVSTNVDGNIVSQTFTTAAGNVSNADSTLRLNDNAGDVGAAQAGSNHILSAEIEDSNGNDLTGETVEFSSNGTVNFANTSVQVNDNGFANTSLTLGEQKQDTITLNASVGTFSANQTGDARINVTTIAADATQLNVSDVSVAPNNTNTVSVSVEDEFGNLNTSQNPDITLNTSNSSVVSISGQQSQTNTSTTNGQAEFSVTAEASSGSATITASASDLTTDSATGSVAEVGGISLTADSSSIINGGSGGANATNFTAQVTDVNGNAIQTNESIRFVRTTSASNAAAKSTGSFQIFSESDGTVDTFRANATGTGDTTFRANIPGTTFSDTATITSTGSATGLNIQAAQSTANVGTEVRVNLSVVDDADRVVPTDLTLSVDTTNGTVDGSSSTSVDTGSDGEANVTFNSSSAGAADVTVASSNLQTAVTTTINVEQAATPTASVTFDDKTVPNGTEEITVESANFTRADGSAGDYVVVVHVVNETRFDRGVDNSISAPVGASGNLSNGAENITVDLNSSAAFEDGDALDSLTENVTLRAMLHTTDNESAFGTRLGVAIDGLEPGDETDDANITVQDEPASDPVERFDTNGEPGIQSGEVLDAISAFNEGEEGVESGDVLDVISAFNEA